METDHTYKLTWSLLIILIVCSLPNANIYAAQVIMDFPAAVDNGPVPVAINLIPGSDEGIGAMQFDLHYDSTRFELAEITAGGATLEAGKDAVFSVNEPGLVRMVVAGLNVDTLGQGPVATAYFNSLDQGGEAFQRDDSFLLQEVIVSDPYGDSREAEIVYANSRNEQSDDESLLEEPVSSNDISSKYNSETSDTEESPLMALARHVLEPASEDNSSEQLNTPVKHDKKTLPSERISPQYAGERQEEVLHAPADKEDERKHLLYRYGNTRTPSRPLDKPGTPRPIYNRASSLTSSHRGQMDDISEKIIRDDVQITETRHGPVSMMHPSPLTSTGILPVALTSPNGLSNASKDILHDDFHVAGIQQNPVSLFYPPLQFAIFGESHGSGNGPLFIAVFVALGMIIFLMTLIGGIWKITRRQ